ncbi:MAG: type II toxin-antitoxin system VapC family toxin [Elusimicrobiota bacterium]|jgi:predicted nucleic acid-binding protein|nr:type II toxin-antitoxin system VapC family toxin [Elusimicrobiota bacterium]
MEILIDASALLAVVLNEAEKQKIVKLTQGDEICCPEIVPYEVGNALSAMLKRHRLNEEQIIKSFNLFELFFLHYVEVDIAAALKIAIKHNIYAYDAYYLEAAFRLKLPLLTLDSAMKNKANGLKIEILEV